MATPSSDENAPEKLSKQELLDQSWLRSQYWYLVGQLELRDSGFVPPYTDEQLDYVNVHKLARVVSDMKKLATVPPPR